MTLETVTVMPPSTNGASHEAETVVEQILNVAPGASTAMAALANHRLECAQFWQAYPAATQMSNGDESYADRRGNYSKGLPHNDRGLVDPTAYIRLFNAATALKKPVWQLVKNVDTVMFCLSKGLGAPWYQRWTRNSAQEWPALAADLADGRLTPDEARRDYGADLAARAAG